LVESSDDASLVAGHKRELHGITPGALGCLRRYAWPGNVRELENVIERAVVLADGPEVTARDLPAEIRAAGSRMGVPGRPRGPITRRSRSSSAG
jgi:DNA-binding NtrC family response regulator